MARGISTGERCRTCGPSLGTTWLIGPLGAVLAIPLTLLVKALMVDIDPGAGWADALLRDRPVAEQAATDAAPPGRTDGAIRHSPSPGQGEVPVH